MSNNLTFGDRIKTLRKLTGLNKKDFAAKHNISYQTYRTWELSEEVSNNILQKFIKIFRFYSNAVVFSEQWLQFGTGIEPYIMGQNNKLDLDMRQYSIEFDDVTAVLDAKDFESKYINSYVMEINDDSMSPNYKMGDYVGGYRINITQDDLVEWAGEPIIIHLQNGSVIFRKLITNNNDNRIILSTMNPYSNSANLCINFDDIKYFIPLYWHRISRKNKLTHKLIERT